MNEPQIRISITTRSVQDKRYRVLVNLQRSDRPRYWVFRCVNCGSKIAEIQNREVYSVVDFYDPQSLDNDGIGFHCKGTLPDRLPCQYSYFFHLQ